MSSEALGIDVVFQLCSERSAVARKYVEMNHKAVVQHIFDDVDKHIDGTGYCFVQKRHCSVEVLCFACEGDPAIGSEACLISQARCDPVGLTE